jgi:prephenate dehydrogenase
MKQAGLVERIIGYSKSPSTTERARQMGVIDQAAESALLAVSGSDIVLLAVPVAATDVTFRAIRHLVHPDVLFMDVGSTKRDVVDAARRVLKERVGAFVPAHPITGKELAGVQHADADLYKDRQVILTPIAQTSTVLLDKAQAVWTALGARVEQMTPEAHDAAFAAVSHLPHLLAFAYFTSILQQKDSERFLSLAGPGFRDFTRIAASDPAIWRDILIANREEILKQSERFRGALGVLEQVLRDCQGEALEALVNGVSQTRSHWRMGAARASKK